MMDSIARSLIEQLLQTVYRHASLAPFGWFASNLTATSLPS
jgi:hypothetical protein